MTTILNELETIEYDWGAAQPVERLTLSTAAGDVVDLTGHDVTLRIGYPGQPAVLEKTAGLTVAAVAPNLTVAWDDDELDFTPDNYRLTILAKVGGEHPRIWQAEFVLRKVVLAAT